MKRRLIMLAMGGVIITGAAQAMPDNQMPGVYDQHQAHSDYKLKCQGCHRPDGSGDAVSNPPMNGQVARFLHVPGGRAFIGQVPGVATVDLDDARLANLINWTLYRFDSGNVPDGFRPYTAAEIGELRKHPLRAERAAVRESLIATLSKAEF